LPAKTGCAGPTTCYKKIRAGSTKPELVSAEKNSFKEVASQLDAGGNLYLYVGTEQLLSGISTKVSDLREFRDGAAESRRKGP